MYKGNIEEWLDSFMEHVLFGKVGFDLPNEHRRFAAVFDLISSTLGDEAFTRFNDGGRGVGRLAPAYYEASVCAFDSNLDNIANKSAADVRSRLQAAFADSRFLSATGPGANTISKLEERIAVVSEYLGK